MSEIDGRWGRKKKATDTMEGDLVKKIIRFFSTFLFLMKMCTNYCSRVLLCKLHTQKRKKKTPSSSSKGTAYHPSCEWPQKVNHLLCLYIFHINGRLRSLLISRCGNFQIFLIVNYFWIFKGFCFFKELFMVLYELYFSI